MADLKAAAEMMRAEVEFIDRHIKSVWELADAPGFIKQQHQAHLLAAQALEAWAWAAAQSMPIEIALRRWRILGRDQRGHLKYYYADTPLGAVLAAMEGERDVHKG